MTQDEKPESFTPEQISTLRGKVKDCKLLIQQIAEAYLTIGEGGFLAGVLSGQEAAISLVEADLEQRMQVDFVDPAELLKTFRKNANES